MPGPGAPAAQRQLRPSPDVAAVAAFNRSSGNGGRSCTSFRGAPAGGQMTMPDIHGRSRQDAIRLLQLSGLPIEKIRVDEVEIKDPGLFEKVADQLPEAGTELMPGGDDTVVVLAVYVQNKKEFSP